MKTISIKDILLTGNFGDVKLGMTKDQVIDILGQPEFDDNTSQKYTGELIYGNYEFFYWKSNAKILGFINSKLSFLGSTKKHHKNKIYFSNETFKVDLSFIRIGHANTNREVKKWLVTNNIPFEEKIDDFNNINLYFLSDVILTFIDTSSYWGIDNNDKVEQVQPLSSTEEFLLEGIRQYDLSISEK